MPDAILSSADQGEVVEYDQEDYHKNGSVGGTGGLWLYEKE